VVHNVIAIAAAFIVIITTSTPTYPLKVNPE
jgi:hypothetical protein